MDILLQQFIPIMRMSSGQRFLIYERMRPVAEELGNVRLLHHLDAASSHEKVTRELENRWSSQANRGRFANHVTRVDALVDTVLSAIRDIVVARSAGLPPSHPVVEEAQGFLAAVFPHGVYAITSLPYVDQVMAVEAIVSKLENQLAPAVARLGLADKVAQLAELTGEYRRLVALGRETVVFAQVRQSRDTGQDLLREAIAIILGTYFDSRNSAHVAARQALLEPVVEELTIQHAKARARRRGSGIDDIDDIDDGGDASDASDDTGQDALEAELSPAPAHEESASVAIPG